MLYNRERRRTTVSLVTCLFQEAAGVDWAVCSPQICPKQGRKSAGPRLQRERLHGELHKNWPLPSSTRWGWRGAGLHYLALQAHCLGIEQISDMGMISKGLFNVLSTERNVQSPKPCGRGTRIRSRCRPFPPGVFYVTGEEIEVTSK